MFNRFLIFCLTTLLMVSSWTGCTRRTAVHHYEKVAVDGWTPGDTLKFRIDSLTRSGNYEPVIGIRTSPAVLYPYRSLWLAVRQQWHNPEGERTDTIECVLTDDNGDMTGKGVSIYQYTFPQKRLYLEAGTSADISISHIMRNDILPGITEIGLRIKYIDK